MRPTFLEQLWSKIESFRSYLPIILCLVPPVCAFLFVYLFGVNVPFWDEWELVPLFQKLHAGTLHFSDLYVQLNEHRIFFSKVIIVAVGAVTRYDTIVLMYGSVLLLCLMTFYLYRYYKRTAAGPRGLWWFVPVPFLVFALNQHFNFLMGLQISFVMMELGALLSFYFIALVPSAEERWYLPALMALLCATLATFSSSGLFVWPIGLLQLFFIAGPLKRKTLMAGAWAVAGALELYLYIFVQARSGWYPSVSNILTHAFHFMHYFLTVLGGALCSSVTWAWLAGLVLLVLFLFCVLRTVRAGAVQQNTFPLAMALFSFALIFSLTAGRFTEGALSSALSSRYIGFSLPVVLSIYFLLLDLKGRRSSRVDGRGLALFLAWVFVSLAVIYPNGWRSGQETKLARLAMTDALVHYRTAPDARLQALFPPHIVRARAGILEDLKYSVFSPKE